MKWAQVPLASPDDDQGHDETIVFVPSVFAEVQRALLLWMRVSGEVYGNGRGCGAADSVAHAPTPADLPVMIAGILRRPMLDAVLTALAEPTGLIFLLPPPERTPQRHRSSCIRSGTRCTQSCLHAPGFRTQAPLCCRCRLSSSRPARLKPSMRCFNSTAGWCSTTPNQCERCVATRLGAARGISAGLTRSSR
jgi:hypothetical protein